VKAISTPPSSMSRAVFRRMTFSASCCTQSKLLPDGALGILQELAASDQLLVGALNNEARETNDFGSRNSACANCSMWR
jgi:hypothetical protein